MKSKSCSRWLRRKAKLPKIYNEIIKKELASQSEKKVGTTMKTISSNHDVIQIELPYSSSKKAKNHYQSSANLKKESLSKLTKDYSTPSLKHAFSSKLKEGQSMSRDQETTKEISTSLQLFRQALVKKKKQVSTMSGADDPLAIANQMKSKMRGDGQKTDLIQRVTSTNTVLKRLV